MTKLKKPISALLLLAFGALLLGGCSTRTAKETPIPWSRPQGWEGQIPGMSGMPGGGGR
jgi:hypothetical protein